MIAEKYIKVGIIAGIVLASATLVISSIPFFLNYAPQISWAFTSNEEILNKMKSTPEYKIFIERFPNAQTKYWRDYSSASLTVLATDEQKEDVLMLNLYADWYAGSEIKTINVSCNAKHRESGITYNTDGILVESFLKETKCLD